MNHYAKLLLVEDDFDLADNLIEFLESRKYSVEHASNGALALDALLRGSFDAILLDLNIPGIHGLELCERLRSDLKDETPVLMLTAADTLRDKLRGFSAGTDDYVVKPFSLEEIEVRLQALLRRSSGSESKVARPLHFHGLEVDPNQMTASLNQHSLKLTSMGFQILHYLIAKAPNIVRRGELEAALWGENLPWSDSLRSHIFALRKELDAAGGEGLLKTIRGVGYQLIPNE